MANFKEKQLLSAEDIYSFKENNYFKLNGPIFPNDDYLRLKKYLYSYINESDEQIKCKNVVNERAKYPHHRDWGRRPELLNLISPILGDDLAQLSIGLCYKPPLSQYRVGWHVDNHSWYKDKVLEPCRVVILFWAFSDMNIDSGCLWVMPKINELKTYEHKKTEDDFNFFKREINEEVVRTNQAIPLKMKENEACLISDTTLHKSETNQSIYPRLGLTIRYISTKTKVNRIPGVDERNIYLLSGKDHAGNQYADWSTTEAVGGFSSELAGKKKVSQDFHL